MNKITNIDGSKFAKDDFKLEILDVQLFTNVQLKFNVDNLDDIIVDIPSELKEDVEETIDYVIKRYNKIMRDAIIAGLKIKDVM